MECPVGTVRRGSICRERPISPGARYVEYADDTAPAERESERPIPVNGTCPEGWSYRKAHTRKGKLIPEMCVKARTSQPKSENPVPIDGTCPEGYTYRKGYTRKGYTRKDGRYVPPVSIEASCVESRGAAAQGLPRGPKLPAKAGELSNYGYHTDLDPIERYQALDRAVLALRKKKDPRPAMTAFRHLNVRATQLKRTAPDASEVMMSDMNYLRLLTRLYDQFGYMVELDEAARNEALYDMGLMLGADKASELLDRYQQYWLLADEINDDITDDREYVIDLLRGGEITN